MAEQKPTLEQILESFKKTLEDVADVVERLAPHCETLADLVGMVRLAEENGGQLKLLYKIITEQKK